jgi:hypothetical protein
VRERPPADSRTESRPSTPRQRVVRADGLDERPCRPGRQTSELLSHPRERPRRRHHIQVPPIPTEAIPVVAEGEAQNIQTRPRRVQAHHLRLGSVHRQPKVLFECPFEPLEDPWPHPPRQYHEIVGVPHQSRVRELGGTVRSVKGPVEVMEVHVGQERRDHQEHRHLRDAVPDRRNPQRPEPAIRSSTSETCVKSGPFAPRALPRFPATMGRSDSRPRPPRGYGFPRRVAPPEHRAGSPRTLDDSVGARPAQPPRTTRRVHLLVASPAITGFTTSGRLAVVASRNEVESDSRVLGSRRCCDGRSARAPAGTRRQTGPFRALSCPPAPDRSYMCERAIHMTDSFQSARVARVCLVHQRRRDLKGDSEGPSPPPGGLRGVPARRPPLPLRAGRWRAGRDRGADRHRRVRRGAETSRPFSGISPRPGDLRGVPPRRPGGLPGDRPGAPSSACAGSEIAERPTGAGGGRPRHAV